jgi:hypothetical protein
LNSLCSATAIIEFPVGARDDYYMSRLVTIILRKNSAAAHQLLATRLHRLVWNRSQP